MNEMEVVQPEEVSETTEATEAAEVSLEEATHDAGAYIESNQSFEQAEAVETAVTEVVVSIIETEPAEAVEEAPQAAPVEAEAVEEVAQAPETAPAEAVAPAGEAAQTSEVAPVETVETVEQTPRAGDKQAVPEQEAKLTKEVDPVTGQSKPGAGGSEEGGVEEEPSLVIDEDQSEIEAPVGSAVDESEAQPGPATAKKEISDGSSERTAKDPLTGKGGENQNSSDKSDSSNNLVMDQTSEEKTPVVEVSDNKNIKQGPGSEVPPSEIDGYENEPDLNTEIPDPEGTLNEIPAQPVGESSDIGPQRLGDDLLPKELKGPLGMGVRGSGNKKPGTVPKSGGGPPVGQHGSGSRGKGPATKNVTTGYTKDGEYFHSDHGGSSQDCSVTVKNTQDLINMHGKNHSAIVECTDGTTYFLRSRGNTFDGDQPMPYTGNWGGGEKPNPDEPQGGLDRESAKVFVVLPRGGGSRDTGGRTPGDKDGDDDSGRFLGDPDLGGGYWTNKDPGDLDYYTPNVLAEALAKAQAK